MSNDQTDSPISLAALAEMVNRGGWHFRRPGYPEYVFSPIKEATSLCDLLRLDEVRVDQATVTLMPDGLIRVCVPHVRREQKKKADGGGWREIPALRVAHHLVNDAYISCYKDGLARKKEEKQRQQEEAERLAAERRGQEARAREEEERLRLARGVKFLAHLNEQYRGKRLSPDQPLRLEGQTLTLTFDDDTHLTVDLFDARDDGYYEEGRLILNGVSTLSFQHEKPNR